MVIATFLLAVALLTVHELGGSYLYSLIMIVYGILIGAVAENDLRARNNRRR